MIEPAKFNSVVSFLWAIADLLNGAFQKSEFQKIILPFTVLRRLDYALEATKAKVPETEHTLKEKGLENRHGQLCRAAGYAFYNTSKFNYESLLHDDANLALNLRQYVLGFSPNVREIFAAFNFDDTIRDLGRVNLPPVPQQQSLTVRATPSPLARSVSNISTRSTMRRMASRGVKCSPGFSLRASLNLRSRCSKT